MSNRMQVRLDPATQSAIRSWMRSRNVSTVSDALRILLQIGLRAETEGVDAARAAAAIQVGINAGMREVRTRLAKIGIEIKDNNL